MIHTPRARRFALAALIAGALVASPTLSPRSWAGESPTPGASVKHATGDKDKGKGKAKHKNRNKNKNDDKDHGKNDGKGKAKNKTDGKGKNNAKAGKAKPAPVVVDDSNTEFKAGKPKAKDRAKPKAAAKTHKATAAPKKHTATPRQNDADCSNPLQSRSTIHVGQPSTVTITVKAGCEWVGGLDSWKLTEPRFVEPQTPHDRDAGTWPAGTHTLAVDTAKCYQLDLYKGVQAAGDWVYRPRGRLLDSTIGGSQPCVTPEPPVDEPKPPVEEKPVPPVEKETPVKETPVVTPPVAKKKAPAPVKKTAPVQPKHPELTGGTLPFTGPRDLLLPAGLGMFALGLALVLAARRREAQLDIAVRAVDRALRTPYPGDHEAL